MINSNVLKNLYAVATEVSDKSVALELTVDLVSPEKLSEVLQEVSCLSFDVRLVTITNKETNESSRKEMVRLSQRALLPELMSVVRSYNIKDLDGKFSVLDIDLLKPMKELSFLVDKNIFHTPKSRQQLKTFYPTIYQDELSEGECTKTFIAHLQSIKFQQAKDNTQRLVEFLDSINVECQVEVSYKTLNALLEQATSLAESSEAEKSKFERLEYIIKMLKKCDKQKIQESMKNAPTQKRCAYFLTSILNNANKENKDQITQQIQNVMAIFGIDINTLLTFNDSWQRPVFFYAKNNTQIDICIELGANISTKSYYPASKSHAGLIDYVKTRGGNEGSSALAYWAKSVAKKSKDHVSVGSQTSGGEMDEQSMQKEIFIKYLKDSKSSVGKLKASMKALAKLQGHKCIIDVVVENEPVIAFVAKHKHWSLLHSLLISGGASLEQEGYMQNVQKSLSWIGPKGRCVLGRLFRDARNQYNNADVGYKKQLDLFSFLSTHPSTAVLLKDPQVSAYIANSLAFNSSRALEHFHYSKKSYGSASSTVKKLDKFFTTNSSQTLTEYTKEFESSIKSWGITPHYSAKELQWLYHWCFNTINLDKQSVCLMAECMFSHDIRHQETHFLFNIFNKFNNPQLQEEIAKVIAREFAKMTADEKLQLNGFNLPTVVDWFLIANDLGVTYTPEQFEQILKFFNLKFDESATDTSNFKKAAALAQKLDLDEKIGSAGEVSKSKFKI